MKIRVGHYLKALDGCYDWFRVGKSYMVKARNNQLVIIDEEGEINRIDVINLNLFTHIVSDNLEFTRDETSVIYTYNDGDIKVISVEVYCSMIDKVIDITSDITDKQLEIIEGLIEEDLS